MKHTIEVNGIHLYAYHGCLPEEKELGGKYSVDIAVTTDFTRALISDKLEDTVDYVKIREIVEAEMGIRSKLIEHVGHRIVLRLQKELNNVLSIRVCITKHNPPISGVVDEVVAIIEV